MRALARVLVAGATLTIWTAGTGLAQHPQKRQGLWIGAGLGYGSLGRTCDACQNFPGEGGPSGYVKVGATPDPRVLMGIEVNGRVGENLSPTPVANFTFGSLGNLTPRAGVFLPGVQQTLLQLALGVTFH